MSKSSPPSPAPQSRPPCSRPRGPLREKPRKRFFVRCGACEHQWVALYTPGPLFLSARVLGSLHCPCCGQDASNLFYAKADA